MRRMWPYPRLSTTYQGAESRPEAPEADDSVPFGVQSQRAALRPDTHSGGRGACTVSRPQDSRSPSDKKQFRFYSRAMCKDSPPTLSIAAPLSLIWTLLEERSCDTSSSSATSICCAGFGSVDPSILRALDEIHENGRHGTVQEKKKGLTGM